MKNFNCGTLTVCLLAGFIPYAGVAYSGELLPLTDFYATPESFTASGKAHINDIEDTGYVTVYFTNNMIAHFNVNWLSPVKVRNTLLGGETKMLVWNDIEVDEKIKIYDKGIEVKNKEGEYNLLVSYRSGDILVPRIEQIEALKCEAEYFVDCINNGKTPINDGYAGLRIVKILAACNESLANKGKMVTL